MRPTATTKSSSCSTTQQQHRRSNIKAEERREGKRRREYYYKITVHVRKHTRTQSNARQQRAQNTYTHHQCKRLKKHTDTHTHAHADGTSIVIKYNVIYRSYLVTQTYFTMCLYLGMRFCMFFYLDFILIFSPSPAVVFLFILIHFHVFLIRERDFSSFYVALCWFVLFPVFVVHTAHTERKSLDVHIYSLWLTDSTSCIFHRFEHSVFVLLRLLLILIVFWFSPL